MLQGALPKSTPSTSWVQATCRVERWTTGGTELPNLHPARSEALEGFGELRYFEASSYWKIDQVFWNQKKMIYRLGRKGTQHPQLKTSWGSSMRILLPSTGILLGHALDVTTPFTDLANQTLISCFVHISNSLREHNTPRAHLAHVSITFANVGEVVSILHPNTANSEAILSSGLAESLTNNLLLSTGTRPSALCPQTCAIRKSYSNILRVVCFFLNLSLYQHTHILAYIDTSMWK